MPKRDAPRACRIDDTLKFSSRGWLGMAVVGSPFCPHKRLRTSCPACKATAIPPPAPNVTPFVTAEEREERESRRAAREASGEPVERKPAAGPRGPGKPLMPTRAKKRGVSAAEAESAKPWWVTK